ncbi:unnamed protein product, partial [Mesorhabditis spiculigera]
MVILGEWCDAATMANELEKGDLIEFSRSVMIVGRKRRVYAHWAIYVGILEDDEGYVVHISTEDGDFGVRPGQDGMGKLGSKIAGDNIEVRCDKLMRVAGADLCRINNSMDNYVDPLPPTIAVSRALNQLGTGGYHLVDNNCEHFAKSCRYGVKESSQVNKAVLAMAGASSLTAASLGSAPAALLFSLSYAAYSVYKRSKWSIIS